MRAHFGGGPLRFLTHDWSKVHPHSFANAPRLAGNYPVVLFRGGGSAPAVNYTTLLEDLASHGYVVVGIDARDGTSRNPELCAKPDCYNRLLALWIADISFVADRLGTVGIFGHSFGGAQAAQFCAHDPRCAAGIDIDGLLLGDVVQHGIAKPFLFLLSDHHNEPGSDRIRADIESVRRPIVVLPGGSHWGFSDDGAVLKSRVLRALFRIDGRRQLAQTARIVRGFFDAHLKR
jgi:pimeloyl-ACP methyl ester carboxylesterase